MPPEATTLNGVDDSDGVAAFLANLTGEDPKRKDDTSTDTSTQTDDEALEPTDTETSAEPGTEETAEETDETNTDTDPDDQEFDIKVGDKTEKAKLKDLKRLFGQEAALTQKSQKLAETTRATEAVHAKATTALTAMTDRAKTAYEPYANLDWLVVAQQMDPEEFKALRADAQTAKANLDFYETELTGLQQQHQQTAQQAHRQAAQECIAALTHPETGIKGWNEKLYTDLMDFAVKNGAPQARQMTSPAAIKIIHMAHQWQKAEDARAAAVAKVEKVVNTPTRVLTPGNSKSTASTQQRSAAEKLRRSGSIDDAADAFLASFK